MSTTILQSIKDFKSDLEITDLANKPAILQPVTTDTANSENTTDNSNQ